MSAPATTRPTDPATCADGADGTVRRRDAGRTRDRLLQAARLRFARHGYAATTVREIADDAAVNVSLINRYFTSKAGLFEACLLSAVEDLKSLETPGGSTGLPAAIVSKLIATADPQARQILPLLLRTSGDEHAEQVRVGMLRRFVDGLAGAATRGNAGDASSDDVLLRAQFAVGAFLGLALLRDVPGFDPVASASEEELVGPMRDMLGGLFPARSAR